MAGGAAARTRLSWREGLYLVGPDPLTSPYYSSGALIVAGVGYATPGFQIGLYLLLFLLAPLYIEAVLLTLSNGGTYVMTRYSLGHMAKVATFAAALVGIVISFSYVATAIVSLLSYADYVSSLVHGVEGPTTLYAIGLSMIPSAGFGLWVMPQQWRKVLGVVFGTTALAVVLSSVMAGGAVVMLAPLIMLFTLNNQGLRESVRVSKTIFLINIAVMAVTIAICVIYLFIHGADFSRFATGMTIDPETVARLKAEAGEHAHGLTSELPGFLTLGAPMILAGAGASILGASGVESVMNIPEELDRPQYDVRLIYRWMLSLLLVIGGSLTIMLFLVLTPEELATKSNYLLAALGERAVEGVTGNPSLARLWSTVIVANAALMLIGATNTGFAGARGLWLTMARDSLLPRMILTPNSRGAFQRIHWLMLGAIFLLAIEAEWNLAKLERWYGATFGLVMFSGMVAFILLRKYKADDRRVYTAPWNIKIGDTRLPIGAAVGLAALGFALLSMYSQYKGEIGELRTLVVTVAVLVGGVVLLHNHRPLIRMARGYYLRVVETVESDSIETEDRTIVVAVGAMRAGRLMRQAVALARQQSKTTDIPYRQLVVFHMTNSVTAEHVYRVEQDSVRPAGIQGSAIRLFTELTELVPDDMAVYLALVPPKKGSTETDDLHKALEALVDFHDSHKFRGHMVMVGAYAVVEKEIAALQVKLEGSTLVPVPLFD